MTSRTSPSVPASTGVLVVGGGLSGLHSAWRLAEAGIDCVLLEARDRLGGRVLSEPGGQSGTDTGYDLGPAWFWPGQSRMETLVAGLGLQAFPQYDRGDLVFENPNGQVAHYPGIAMMGGSLRLAGGLGQMIDALAAKLPALRLFTGKRLTALRRTAQGLVATIADRDGHEHAMTCERVLLALPPRLVATQIACDPALPPALLSQLAAIPTWMAGHAKVIALYDRPFWRDEGLSGDASSRRGPLMEIHDASPAPVSTGEHETGALFGFVGIPAAHRAGRDSELLAATREQLARLFGKAAGEPLQLLYKDWATEPYTAVPADADPPPAHPAYGLPPAAAGLWDGRLILSGTETASEHGGFLEGALEASETSLRRLLPATTAASQQAR